MSNPFGEPDENGSEILEGFLCPICREDLKSLQFLTDHFKRLHAEEQDALKSAFKDIFVKAKNKIKLNFDDTFDIARSVEKVNIGGSNAVSLEFNKTHTNVNHLRKDKQQVGVERSHLEYFESVRNPRLERYACETNKLIIRLHKLLKDLPTDAIQRKQHEQNTVAWLDGASVKLCPSCAKSFHIARRQHHCRLCGSIMCHDCSQFLSLETALELASLTMFRTEALKKQQLQSSSSSQVQNNGIRCCDHCLWLLEKRQEMHESRTSRTRSTQLYEEIQQFRKSSAPNIEMYLKIVASLYDGESIFTIADASTLRGKIGKTAESIDMLSKRILALPCETGSREEILKKAIRMACVKIIKENMLSLPPLPLEDEIRKIQERKRMEAEQRIETERRQAMEALERYELSDTKYLMAAQSSQQSGAQSYAQGSDLQSLDNWSAHQATAMGKSKALHDDPLVEQINIIKGYIKQARRDMNFDVVETLELNLRELQHEFYERQSAIASSNQIQDSEKST